MVRSVPTAFDMPILLKLWTDQVQILSAYFMCNLMAVVTKAILRK